jgi:hypothetical protein
MMVLQSDEETLIFGRTSFSLFTSTSSLTYNRVFVISFFVSFFLSLSKALVSSGSGTVIQRLGNHVPLFLWQRFSDVVHRHITAAGLRYRYSRKPKLKLAESG